jgi:hypothetical protein
MFYYVFAWVVLCSVLTRAFLEQCRKEMMFDNDEVISCTVGQIAKSFSPRGMLGTGPASVGIYLLGQKYAGSDKLIVPYWVAVRFSSIVFCPFLLFLFVNSDRFCFC